MATPLASLRAPAPLSRWWSSKSGAERRIIAGVASLAIAALAWWVVWQPLTRDIAVMRQANARGLVALAEARAMTEEMAGLARAAAARAGGDPRADFERALAAQNLSASVSQQDWKEGRGRIVFSAVSYEALIAGLEALQRDAQLRVVEATLTARVEPGIVRAETVLTR
jgi:type II secretory pathway component PulM